MYERTEMLLGAPAVDRLKKSSVAVFGVGGVGGYAAEALARSGIGCVTLCDSDTVTASNINRQLAALHSTLGRYKADVMSERIQDINPDCKVTALRVFYDSGTAEEIDLSGFSYIVDAIDTVKSKILLIERAKAAGVPIISSMGAGNKLNPDMFEAADIYGTSVCPLAKAVRKALRERGADGLKVVYSKEIPLKTAAPGRIPGSVSFTPPVAGMIMAGEVIKDLTGCGQNAEPRKFI